MDPRSLGSVTPVRLPKNRKAPALINKTGAYILCLYHSLNQHTFICAPVTAEIPARLNGIRVQPRGSEVIFDPRYLPPVSHRHRLALRFCAELLSSSMPLKIMQRTTAVLRVILYYNNNRLSIAFRQKFADYEGIRRVNALEWLLRK